MEEQGVTQADLSRYVARINAEAGAPVDKILIRTVTPQLYAVQTWRQGEREPEGYYLHVEDDTEE
jgi:hypothetical protein